MLSVSSNTTLLRQISLDAIRNLYAVGELLLPNKKEKAKPTALYFIG